MPDHTMDMEMGEMNNSTEYTEYTDFEFQQIEFKHVEEGDNSARATFDAGVEPLEDRGGLDVNEVAELKYAYLRANAAVDAPGGQNSSDFGVIDYRGVFGINLDTLGDDFSDGSNRISIKETSDALQELENSDSSLEVKGRSDAVDKLLNWQIYGHTAYNDEATGSGGGGSNGNPFTREVDYRQRFGSGPVLDSNDDLSVVSTLVKNRVNDPVEAFVSVDLVWDIAEIENTRARFSRPF